MPILYADANPKRVAWLIEGGNISTSGYTDLPPGQYTIIEAEYLAIIYGLNALVMAWSREGDERREDIDIEASRAEGALVFANVARPAAVTRRELPRPLLIRSDCEPVIKQLSREHHIRREGLLKLAQTVWGQVKHLDARYEWVPRADNPAGKMLK